VLAVIVRAGDVGATAKEVATALGVGLNEISGRCTELRAAGLVRKKGLRREGSAVLVATGECEGR
jgi:predicted transcriptional regulator